MIRKMIEEIIEKYYREDGEYYSRDREDESGNDLEMDEEIKSALEEKKEFSSRLDLKMVFLHAVMTMISWLSHG